jgi:hypothetical protein
MYARMRKTSLGPFATDFAFCGVFEPWAVCYFPHHPTTRPHVTAVPGYVERAEGDGVELRPRGGGGPPGGRPTTPPRKDLLTTMPEPEPEPLPGSSGSAETTVRRTWVGVALSLRAYTDARCPSVADWMVESTDSQDDDSDDDDDNDDNDALSSSGLPPRPFGCVLSMVRLRQKVEMVSVLPPSPAADATLDAVARPRGRRRYAGGGPFCSHHSRD